MKVKVKYLGPVSLMLRKREEELEVSSGTSMRELLRMLSNQYGQAFANEILQDDGKVRLGIGIVVNGAAIGQLAGLSTRLKVGDTIALLPLFLGGG